MNSSFAVNKSILNMYIENKFILLVMPYMWLKKQGCYFKITVILPP